MLLNEASLIAVDKCFEDRKNTRIGCKEIVGKEDQIKTTK